MLLWVYIGLLGVLLTLAIAGQVAYTRALSRSGIVVPRFVKVLRAVNLSLLGVVLVGAVAYLVIKG